MLFIISLEYMYTKIVKNNYKLYFHHFYKQFLTLSNKRVQNVMQLNTKVNYSLLFLKRTKSLFDKNFLNYKQITKVQN